MSNISHTRGATFKMCRGFSLRAAHNGPENDRLLSQPTDTVYVHMGTVWGTMSYEEASRLSKHLGLLCAERRRDVLEQEKQNRKSREDALLVTTLNGKAAMMAMMDGAVVVPFNQRDESDPLRYFLDGAGQVVVRQGLLAPGRTSSGPLSENPWDTKWVTWEALQEYKGIPASTTVDGDSSLSKF